MTTSIDTPQFPSTGNPLLDDILAIVYAERFEPRDRLQRVASTINMLPEQRPVAWVRKHPDGDLTTEYLSNGSIEDLRKRSGAWVPLYTSSCKTAAFEMPNGLKAAIAQAKDQGQRVAIHDGNAVFFSCDGDSELPGHDVDLNCPYCGGSGHKDDIPNADGVTRLPEHRYDWVAKSIDNAEFACNRLLSGDTREQFDASIDAEIAKDK